MQLISITTLALALSAGLSAFPTPVLNSDRASDPSIVRVRIAAAGPASPPPSQDAVVDNSPLPNAARDADALTLPARQAGVPPLGGGIPATTTPPPIVDPTTTPHVQATPNVPRFRIKL